MNENQKSSIEACMLARGDHPILTLRYDGARAVMRYAVGASSDKPSLYSIYAEYTENGERHAEVIPAFSRKRDTAENFCAMLARFSVTPLSLHALYEDTLTP